jgi:hypothetical protein
VQINSVGSYDNISEKKLSRFMYNTVLNVVAGLANESVPNPPRRIVGLDAIKWTNRF